MSLSSKSHHKVRIILLTCTILLVGLSLLESSNVAFAKPQIGIYYYTWFDYNNTGHCDSDGWLNGSLRPFQFDYSNLVGSLLWYYPTCYSTNNDSTYTVHAQHLHDLGIDFVIYDNISNSKQQWVSNDNIFAASVRALQNFRLASNYGIKSVFMFSIVEADCAGCTTEHMVWDNQQYGTIHDHLRATLTYYRYYPDAFLIVDGKPLILIYISQGTNVYNNGSPAFGGPYNMIPHKSQFDPLIPDDYYGGGLIRLRDVFTIRYAIVADNWSGVDYNYWPEVAGKVWPFRCNGNCMAAEAGYASVYAPNFGRHASTFTNYLSYINYYRNPFMVIRSWNEFSTTNEWHGDYPNCSVYTLEPNNRIHWYDESNGNPWYFFIAVSWYLHYGFSY